MPRKPDARPSGGSRLAEATLASLIEAAPIARVQALNALRWLCQVVPLQHRLFPLLRTCLPDRGLITIPFAGGTILYPAAWVSPYNASQLVALDQLFPERRLFEETVASAPRGVVVDVGSNIGAYVLLARSATAARVVAYEPSPFAYHVLKRMLAVNGFAEVDVRLQACGDRPGRVCLQEGINSYVGGTADARQARAEDFEQLSRQTRDGFTAIDVEQVTLDDALADERDVALIKIDCEGFEHHVLLGARRLLAEKRPHLFIELHPEMIRRAGHAPEDVRALLHEAGYTIECWNFQRARRASLVPRVLGRYRAARGHRYRDIDDMLKDLPLSRPQQVYLVARPDAKRAGS
jgi:FkbM family methyltransferase